MCVYLGTRFQVSSIILTSFRQGVILHSPPQKEPLKSPPKLGLSSDFSIKTEATIRDLQD